MCTSAPEDATAHPYFADYEVYDGGQCIAWGQVTLSSTPDTAMQAARACAADQQDVDVGAIRLRALSRL